LSKVFERHERSPQTTCEAERCFPIQIRSAFRQADFGQSLAGRRMISLPLGHSWPRACVLVLLVTIPDVARPDPSGPQAPANRQIQLAANAEKGGSLFQNRCSMCHSTQEGGPNKFGPNLHGLFGRQAASLPEYNYSNDLRGSGIVWNSQTLDEYLADPHRGRRDAKMAYPGLSSKTDRTDLISYLEQATR
jgi:cytochrome c